MAIMSVCSAMAGNPFISSCHACAHQNNISEVDKHRDGEWFDSAVDSSSSRPPYGFLSHRAYLIEMLTSLLGGNTKRMPSDHGQKGRRGSNSHSSGTGNSRKSSSVNLPVATTASSHAAASRGDVDQPKLSDLEPLNFDQIQQDGLAFVNDPAAGQKWLLGFGYYQEDTDVSLRFLSKTGQIQSGAPSSILPLLAQWIVPWFKNAHEKRKAEKGLKTPAVHEFDWLLQFVAAYLKMEHENLNEQEIHQLCEALIEMDQLTTRFSDIDASITIMHQVAICGVFPNELLEPAVDILCASTTVAHDTLPPSLSACFKLFLLGDMHEQVLDQMFAFIVTPTTQNNLLKMNQGRGSLRQLSSALDLTDAEDNLVINTSQFVDALLIASRCCIFRYCTEVLRAFHAIFESRQAGKILSNDFMSMMEAIDHCIQTVLHRSNTSRSPVSTQSPDRDEVLENEKQSAKHLAERNQVMKKLFSDFETHWTNLTWEQQQRLSGLLTDHAKDLSDSQAAMVISNLPVLNLIDNDVAEISTKAHSIFDAFIRNGKISSQNRLSSITYCASLARSLILDARNSHLDSQNAAVATASNIVDRLLTVLSNEHEMTVITGIVNSLTDLACLSHELPKYPCADLVVRKLLWLIKNERDEDDEAERGVLFTSALCELFLRGFSSAAPVAAKAFDALLEVAEIGIKSRACRLAALRLLVRIRCDAKGMIYLETAADSEYIAVALCRTDEARDSFAGESHPAPRLSTNSAHASYFGPPKQLWSYPEESSVTLDWPTVSSTVIGVKGHMGKIQTSQAEIRMSNWLVTAIRLFQADVEWETLSFMLVHFGAQLANTKLFTTSLESIVKLRQILCDQVNNGTFREPPAATGLKKSDTALCMFNVLTGLIPFAAMKSEHIQKGFGDDLVKAFLSGIGGAWDGTSRGCIHALCVCSFEVPASVASQYPNIITKMSKNMTQSHLTIHILEFLAQVARLPEVHSNFNQDEITMIFGICLQFLEKAREQHILATTAPSPRSGTPARHSGLSLRRPPYRAAMLQDLGLPQYASALAYHTMIFWFLSLKLEVRAFYVSWIVSRLIWKNSNGDDTIDEQSQVFIDFMQRTAFSDLGETKPDPDFSNEVDGAISAASWIVGLSIVTAESAGRTGKSQITKRQAAGTTYSIYQQLTAPLPDHHIPSRTEIRAEDSRYGATSILPPHILLQMAATAAPTSVADQPIPLPREDYITRALSVFDRIPTVDSHKLGVIFVDHGQTQETEYLANTRASQDFQTFLDGLGFVVSLDPPLEFNPQGLLSPRDGKTTIAWRDRVTEIVYHVPTLMPNDLANDPSCNTKKSHVGNCNVVIIFNQSGIPWEMANFPSAVTCVHIIITPTNRMGTSQHIASDNSSSHSSSTEFSCDFFNVHVVTKEDYPNVTPAADPKVISRAMLPGFVRMLALSASVFSQAKLADDNGDHEFPSSWRTRLQHIKTLKQRVLAKNGGHPHGVGGIFNSVNASSITAGRRTPVLRGEGLGSGGDAERDASLAAQLDFGKWNL